MFIFNQKQKKNIQKFSIIIKLLKRDSSKSEPILFAFLDKNQINNKIKS